MIKFHQAMIDNTRISLHNPRNTLRRRSLIKKKPSKKYVILKSNVHPQIDVVDEDSEDPDVDKSTGSCDDSEDEWYVESVEAMEGYTKLNEHAQEYLCIQGEDQEIAEDEDIDDSAVN